MGKKINDLNCQKINKINDLNLNYKRVNVKWKEKESNSLGYKLIDRMFLVSSINDKGK
jgi:hypothetical protein